MTLKTKRVYDKPEDDDGCRILVMRYWPRGIRKDAVDAWEKELGAPPALIKDWKAGKVTWAEFAKRYRAAMKSQKDSIGKLAAMAGKENVTLLCGCPDESRCHRGILAGLVKAAARRM